jgi:hypothetical protein
MAIKTVVLTLAYSLLAYASPQQPEDFATYYVDDAQLSRYESRMRTFEASLTADPRYSSISSVGNTAFPATLNWDEVLAPGKTLTTEEWYKALPTDIKSWWFSVASEERRLITDTADGPAATSAGSASAPSSSGSTSAVTRTSTSGSSKTNASTSASQTAASKTNAAIERVGDVRFAQGLAVGVAGAIGAVALLL